VHLNLSLFRHYLPNSNSKNKPRHSKQKVRQEKGSVEEKMKSIGLENEKHDIAPGHPRRIRTHDKKLSFRLFGGADQSAPPDKRPEATNWIG